MLRTPCGLYEEQQENVGCFQTLDYFFGSWVETEQSCSQGAKKKHSFIYLFIYFSNTTKRSHPTVFMALVTNKTIKNQPTNKS